MPPMARAGGARQNDEDNDSDDGNDDDDGADIDDEDHDDGR